MSVYFNLFYRLPKESYSLDDELSVQIYYYYLGKKINVSTGVRVKLKDWNDRWNDSPNKNPIKKTDPDYNVKNILVKQKVLEIESIVSKILLNNQIPTTNLVKSYLTKNTTLKTTENNLEFNFLYIIEQYLKDLENSQFRHNHTRSVKSIINIIREFIFSEYHNPSSLLLSDIDDEFQTKLLSYLESKKNQPSTIHKRLKTLCSIVNWSVKKNYIKTQIKPIKFPSSFEKDVIFLQRNEILELYNFNDFNFESENHKHYTSRYYFDKQKNDIVVNYTNLEVYRDMLLFGCGLGCRYGDMVKLTLDNYIFDPNDRTKGEFWFYMEKSRNRKKVTVPINSLTYEIWKKYSKNKSRTDFLFPRNSQGGPIFNQKMNDNLKVIGKIVGLNRLVSKPVFNIKGEIQNDSDVRIPLYSILTTHIMRRTFIREGLNSGIPTHIIMSMSGHTSERIFKQYYSITKEERDLQGEKLFLLKTEDKDTTDVNQIMNDNNIREKIDELKKLLNEGFINHQKFELLLDKILVK